MLDIKYKRQHEMEKKKILRFRVHYMKHKIKYIKFQTQNIKYEINFCIFLT